MVLYCYWAYKCLLSNPKALTELNVSNNKVAKLPLEITHLHNLTALNAGMNSLVDLPIEIYKLSSLTRLRLCSNLTY